MYYDIYTGTEIYSEEETAALLREKAMRDNRSNQLNPNNWRYWASRQNKNKRK